MYAHFKYMLHFKTTSWLLTEGIQISVVAEQGGNRFNDLVLAGLY